MKNIFNENFFKPVFESQSYLNIVYLLLAFPLGLAYFITLITGTALGVSLTIIWVGLFILFLLLELVVGLTFLERIFYNFFLGRKIELYNRSTFEEEGFFAKLKAQIKDPQTWKGFLFLLIKFPLGLVSFVTTVVLLSTSLGCISAIFFYKTSYFRVWNYQIENFAEATIVSLFGLLLGVLSIHILNLLAELWKIIGSYLLTVKADDIDGNNSVDSKEEYDVSKLDSDKIIHNTL